VWGSFYVWINPLWRVRVAGREHLPWRGPAVVVANHLSLLDVLVLYGLFRPFRFVAKAELFRIPFIGWNMWLDGSVPLRRGDRESIKQMMVRCRWLLDRGVPVLLFPEGTRSPDGALQHFKDGAFRLAREAGCPVVPVALSGTDALPKHGLVLRKQMNARLTVLPPLHPADYPSAEALRDAAHAAIAAALAARPA
jgi:1-acyl-sn-glycerol-3-phosphate acyltransferase